MATKIVLEPEPHKLKDATPQLKKSLKMANKPRLILICYFKNLVKQGWSRKKDNATPQHGGTIYQIISRYKNQAFKLKIFMT
jgi:hypothetical protein